MTPGEFKNRGRELELHYGFHMTPFGECLIAVTTRGICSLGFVDQGNREQVVAQLFGTWREATLIERPQTSERVARQIFAPNKSPGAAPVNVLLHGTNFQIKVWEALLRIPEGAVVSYGALADAVNHPGAHRAVGTALGHNPVAYLIPCHRVLRNNGDIGGYRWGIARKRAILAMEAAHSAERRGSPRSFALGPPPLACIHAGRSAQP
jgi:AraC family transcriptional regulator of adaptative response/methylated-DNA-[protein]-cysteine methyltransferase